MAERQDRARPEGGARRGGARIRVLVADDHPLFRSAVADAIKRTPELELVGEAEEGREALELIRELDPEVALLDYRMPGLDASQILNALSREESGARVLLLSAQLGREESYRAIEAGAAGLLDKDASGDEIREAITRVSRGETVISGALQAELAGAVRLRGVERRMELTGRELETLRCLAEGLSAPEIAKRLHLSTPTVKTHLKRLYEKLGVSDRAAAVAQGMRQGLVE
jgi:two-component system nitrate/nitrite response regulator NarL